MVTETLFTCNKNERTLGYEICKTILQKNKVVVLKNNILH